LDDLLPSWKFLISKKHLNGDVKITMVIDRDTLVL